jgi:hypothetical protein
MNKSITSLDSQNSIPREAAISLRSLDRHLRAERESLLNLRRPRRILMF